jgi:beta-N-acetylhexosaminidase
MTRRAFITGVSGPTLTIDEIAFLADARPWGLILFARNIGDREQIIRLIEGFRDAVHDGDAPVLIDQEGGRVQRLRLPRWSEYPAARVIGALYRRDRESGQRAAYLTARLIGDDLLRLGITVDCAPVLDLAIDGAHPVIGERAFGAEPDTVVDLATAAVEGFRDAGVLPVIKHLPGHGRGTVDSHFDLPRVSTSRTELERLDFAPFRAFRRAELGMTAHIIYEAIDPDHPATESAAVIQDVIRGTIGFTGALMTDDLGMKALSGSYAERTRRALTAGADLALHCSGVMAEMVEVAAAVPMLAGDAAERCEAALRARRHAPKAFDRGAAEADLTDLLAVIDAADTFRPAREAQHA